VLEEDSFDFCYDYGFRLFKLHGTDLTNIPFLKKISAKEDCKIILETQCSTYQDIECGLEVINDSVEAIFHGFSNFPTEIEDLNLNAIKALRNDFPDYKYGFADHTLTTKEIPLLALGLGYDYFEKHITLTRHNRNFDWQGSLYPEEFSQMVQSIRMYNKAMGKELKHPCKNELSFRDIIYKKVQPESQTLKRNDTGLDYLSDQFASFDKSNISIALIARLKSKRLKRKVLKKFCEKSIIEDLFSRLNTCKTISSVKLATSPLEEDAALVKTIGENNTFLGHPVSVLDRMLSLARQEKSGGIFRVTGDNPFTDPGLIDKMSEMFINNDLDYIRVNNVPFGVSAELFSVKYLWHLYLKMDNPLNSEYLSWFVLNDKNCKKGCINFIPNKTDTKYVNLSIDYQEDYDRSEKVLEKISKKDPRQILFSDIIQNIDLTDLMDKNKIIKLPEGNEISFENYLALMNNIEYNIKIDLYE
jgi:spore coat polysaccharide biosynthesis protein SpsF (cytidylyltransferase family)